MDNGANPPNKRNAGRAAVASRTAPPPDPRGDDDPAHPAEGAASGANGAHGATNGDSVTKRGGRGLRRPLRRSSSNPEPPAESVIPVGDAVWAPATTGAATAAGPVLLPPIRTAPNSADRPIVHKVLRPPDAPVRPAESPGVPAAPVAPGVPPPTVEPVGLAPAPVDPATIGSPPVPFDDPLATAQAPVVARTTRQAVTFKRRSTRPRVRRVTRVVRHVDTWSVFKVALVFSVFIYAVSLTAGVLLWHVAVDTGTIDNVEKFFEGFGWTTFEFKGGEIYHSAWVGGMFVAIGLTGLAVLMATLFNLITDLVGGIRVSVLEEEVLARRDRTPVVTTVDEPGEDAPFDQARA